MKGRVLPALLKAWALRALDQKLAKKFSNLLAGATCGSGIYESRVQKKTDG